MTYLSVSVSLSSAFSVFHSQVGSLYIYAYFHVVVSRSSRLNPFQFSSGGGVGRNCSSFSAGPQCSQVDSRGANMSQAPILDPVPQGREIDYSDLPGLSHILGEAVGNELTPL